MCKWHTNSQPEGLWPSFTEYNQDLTSIIEQRYTFDTEDPGFELSIDLSSSVLLSPCHKSVFHLN